MNEYENEYLDEYDDCEQYEPPRPYTAEQLAEREEWIKIMSEIALLVCAPINSED